jgi:hypothetical protein
MAWSAGMATVAAMKALLVFALFDGATLIWMTVAILTAPEGEESERGYRIIGPSALDRLRAHRRERRAERHVPIGGVGRGHFS